MYINLNLVKKNVSMSVLWFLEFYFFIINLFNGNK